VGEVFRGVRKFNKNPFEIGKQTITIVRKEPSCSRHVNLAAELDAGRKHAKSAVEETRSISRP
jgi:hypothetical protein